MPSVDAGVLRVASRKRAKRVTDRIASSLTPGPQPPSRAKRAMAARGGGAPRENKITERYRSGRNGGASKASCPKGHVGSNPTLSARLRSQLRCELRLGQAFGLAIFSSSRFLRAKSVAPKRRSREGGRPFRHSRASTVVSRPRRSTRPPFWARANPSCQRDDRTR
jgi:hypothetical protein